VQQTIHDVNLKKLVAEAIAIAKKEGASEVEVSANLDDGFTSIVRMGEIDTVEYQRDREIDITVYFGHKKGSATTTEIKPESLMITIKKACDIAKFTGEDPYNGLADKALMAQYLPDLSLYHPWDLSAEQGVELALACEAKARQLDKRITNSDSVSVTSFQAKYVYGNSHGFLGEINSTQHEISCILIAEQDEEMERDFAYSLARDPKDLIAIEKIADEAVSKTISRLGARKIKTCKVPVIFIAEEACSLWGHFVSAIAGSQLYRKSSFLLDCLEKQIFPEFIHLYEDPYLLKGMGSTAFDSDGVATTKKYFISKGFLKSYCLGAYSARKLGMQTTGNADGVHNLIIEPGEKDLPQLLKLMDRGLLVTEVMGQGVNILTGDYSRGARGFWVEQGKIQFPVSEITIAGNLQTMFRSLIAVGNDIDYRGNIHTGSVLLGQLTVAGN